MKPSACRRAGVAFAALLMAALPLSGRDLLDWLLPKHEVEVIVVTDETPAGALRRPVTPASPVYYQAVSMGYRDFGGMIGGDRIPPKERMLDVIAKVLAKRGYLPGSAQHPPSLLLIWSWGTMYVEKMPTGDPNDPEGRQINRKQLLRFMGAYKLGLVSQEPSHLDDDLIPIGAMFRDPDRDLIYQLSSEDLYVIGITAYDYAAAAQNQRVKLWTTKISCPSIGLAMDSTLPAMLALAAPHIGRETAKPVSLLATDHFKADVEIGDATVVEYLESSKAKVVEVSPKQIRKAKPKK